MTLPDDPALREFIASKLELIGEAYAPYHIIFFGSRVWGQARADSDIDLIIVSDVFQDIKFVNRMFHFLQTVKPERTADAICYTPEEFERMRTGEGFIPDVCRDGLWL